MLGSHAWLKGCKNDSERGFQFHKETGLEGLLARLAIQKELSQELQPFALFPFTCQVYDQLRYLVYTAHCFAVSGGTHDMGLFLNLVDA